MGGEEARSGFQVVIAGTPPSQARPRFRIIKPKSGAPPFAHVYPPTANKVWANSAQWLLQQAREGRPLLEGPIEVVIRAVFPAMRGATNVERVARIRRPDVDNIAKAVLDAATGVWFTDDEQVVCLLISKWNGAVREMP